MSGMLDAPEFILPLLLVGGYCLLQSFGSWVRGVQLLVVVMVFGGIVGARIGNTALPVLFRDVLIVLPLYLAFVFSRSGREAFARLPMDLALGVCVFVAWLIVCLFNPAGGSALQVLIGLKVWLLYLPFLPIGVALALRQDALFKVMRALLICGLAACGVGLLQSALIRTMGYGPAIKLFFGNAAAAVTQGFAFFNEGGGIYRIPATFSFGAQYVAFVFLFVAVAIIEANADPDLRYRRLGRIGFFVGVIAGLFSGSKGAFLMFPLFVVGIAAFGLIKSRLVVAAPIAVGVGLWTISAAGLDPTGLASFGASQAEAYGQGFIFQQIADAMQHGMMGEGIGSSTGAARFVASAFATRLGYESYFAKSAAEIGIVGMIVISAFLLLVALRAGALAFLNYGQRRNLVVAPLVLYIAYVLVTCFKGYPLDIDPGNVFFWLAVGIVFGMSRAPEPQPQPQPTVPQPGLPTHAGA